MKSIPLYGGMGYKALFFSQLNPESLLT